MLKTGLIQEPEIWRSMCQRFPWVLEERGESGEGLVHLEFAALRRGVESAADSGNLSRAREILAFVEELFQKAERLHPEVLNALDISFLTDLYLGEPRRRAFILPLLQPKTLHGWNEIREAHERGDC